MPGADPTEASAILPVNGEVQVPLPGWLKARAWNPGMNASPAKTAVYRRGCTVSVRSAPVDGVSVAGSPDGVGGTTEYGAVVESGTPVALTAPETLTEDGQAYPFDYWNSTAPVAFSRTWPAAPARIRNLLAGSSSPKTRNAPLPSR